MFRCFLLLNFLHPSAAIAEGKRFTVKIIIPASVNEINIVIDYDNGNDDIKVPPHNLPYGYPRLTGAALRQLYDSIFPDNLKKSPEGAAVLKILTALNTRKNEMAPDFTTTDIYQHPIALHDYRNKYVLLNFWASWCGPCVAELPAIKKIRDTYTGDQLGNYWQYSER